MVPLLRASKEDRGARLLAWVFCTGLFMGLMRYVSFIRCETWTLMDY